jgi:hypothetical protein
MPVSPCHCLGDTQTRKVNSSYYAVDKPGMPKSLDWGVYAEVGKHEKRLLIVQGPLGLDWGRRKSGLVLRLEYVGLTPCGFWSCLE